MSVWNGCLPISESCVSGGPDDLAPLEVPSPDAFSDGADGFGDPLLTSSDNVISSIRSGAILWCSAVETVKFIFIKISSTIP